MAEHVNAGAARPTADRERQLRELFPEAVSEGRIDFDKLRLLLGEAATGSERYQFSWAGRADAIDVLRTPSRATLLPDRDRSLDFDATKNAILEGDNLEVLKLLARGYSGRVKLIYIDPPYNTGNDFVYPDDFRDPLSVYLRMTGQADAAGNLLTSNPDTGGRYHSAWLSMMYPRLFLARQLLRDDGVLCVSIDDHEVHHLRMILNEVFGEENFVAQIVWQKKYSPANDAFEVSAVHDYIVMYKRGSHSDGVPSIGKLSRTDKQDSAYKNPDNDPRGPWKAADYTCNKSAEERPNLYYPLIRPTTGEEVWPNKTRVWGAAKDTHEANVADNRIWWGITGNAAKPAFKRFLSEMDGMIVSTWWPWSECGHTDEARKEVIESFPEAARTFDTPKPTRLIKRILEISTQPGSNDIVLDFFAGSGTAGQAVLELNREDGGNRQVLLVQLQEPTGNPQFPTIADICIERVRRVVAKLKAATGDLTRAVPEDLGFKVFRLAESHVKVWAGVEDRTPAGYQKALTLFTEESLRDGWTAEGVLWEVALREGYGLNATLAAVAGVPSAWRVSDPDKSPRQSLVAVLSPTLPPDLTARLGLTANDVLVVRESALDDTLAANLSLQCRLKAV